jgi:hypothetical protein
MGYTFRDTIVNTWRDRMSGKVHIKKTRVFKYMHPDVTACIFWLKNRHANLWRDVYRSELTGKDGRAIQANLVPDETSIQKLSNLELQAIEKLGLKMLLNPTNQTAEGQTIH